MFTRDAVASLCVDPEKLCRGARPAVRPGVCRGTVLGLRWDWCVQLHPLSLGQESLWCGAGPCRGCSHSAWLVALLQMGSGQGGARSSRERGAGCGASEAHTDLQEGLFL